MGIEFALFDHTAVYLVSSELSAPPIESQLSYPFDLPQAGQRHSPNHFNAHWLPMIFSLPHFCQSFNSVIHGSIAQF